MKLCRTLTALTCLLISGLTSASLTIGTYNIRNFDYDERERINTDKLTLANILRDLNFDLLGVNEIAHTAEFNRLIGSKLPEMDVTLSNCGGAHGQHLGFVYKKSKLRLVKTQEQMEFSGEGNQGGCFAGSRPAYVGLFEDVATRERFYAVQLHLKSGSNAGDMAKRARQYQLMQELVKKLTATDVKSVVMMGDMNTTGYLDKDEDYRRFTAMVSGAKLTDLSAKLGCSAYWWGGTEDGIESPSLLDHVLVAGPIVTNRAAQSTVRAHCQAVSCREASPSQLGVSYTGVSDHCPQTATIR